VIKKAPASNKHALMMVLSAQLLALVVVNVPVSEKGSTIQLDLFSISAMRLVPVLQALVQHLLLQPIPSGRQLFQL
jgi:hypothetical protein